MPAGAPGRRGTTAAAIAIGVLCLTLLVAVVVVLRPGHKAAATPPSAAALVHAAVTSGHRPGTWVRPPVTPIRMKDGAVIDPRSATRVVRTYWHQHERALVEHDLVALRRLSDGPDREWEQPSVICGCLSLEAERPLLQSSVFVPRQTHYPASFVAEVKTHLYSDEVQVLVFTKQAPTKPWLATQMTYTTAPANVSISVSHPTRDAHGYDRPVSGAQHQRAQTIAAHFAALWQAAKTTGVVPTVSEFFLTTKGKERLGHLALHPQDAVQFGDVSGHFQFYASPHDPLMEVTLAGGYELACQPIRETVLYRAQGGGDVVQDPAQQNFSILAPGRYREVTSRDVWQTCYMLPRVAIDPVWVFFTDDGGAVATGAH